MKKYIFTISAFLLVIFLPGCEKEFDGLVESGESSYTITGVNSFSAVDYGLQDSTIQLWIQLENDNDVSSVSCEILDPDGDELKGSPVSLTKGQGRYTGQYTLSYADVVGQYTINYYISDAISGSKLVASHYFNYDNGQANVAPVLSDLVMADTLFAGLKLFYSIKVSDANGLKDVTRVYYEVYDPNGTKVENSSGISQFPMFDDGINGEDAVKGDNIFTVAYNFNTELTGTWRFEFTAQDRRGLLSEKITHNLVVK